MTKRILLLLILQVYFTGYCQEIDEKYLNETKLFLQYIVPEFFGNTHLIINKTAPKVNIKDCKLAYESEKLSKAELIEVKEKTEKPKIIYWTNYFFPLAKIIDNDKITETFKDQEKGWNIFREKYGNNVTEFSSPIFLRNYNIAIIRFSIAQDYLAGYGYEGIFFKTEKGWDMAACSWDN